MTDQEQALLDGRADIRESRETNGERAPKGRLMTGYLNASRNRPLPGDLVEGTVIALETSRVFVDLAPFGVGVIYGREYMNARDVIKKMNIGDEVTTKVVETENDEGYVELSLKEARQALIWNEAEKAMQEKTVFDLAVKDANKGGLIIEWQGMQGFIPASQLKTEHYPRVEDGDKDKILEELRKLVGTTLSVAIIAVNSREGKLIFSEKNPQEKEKEKIIGKYEVGDIIEGEVTGAVDFGIFVKLEEGLEGLAHISELDWALVDDPRRLFAIGSSVRVKIIEIKDGQISLSVKALKENPWKAAATKYAKGDVVDAVVIKYNKHGALASIEEGVAGLVHISEFPSEEALRQTLALGRSYKFRINLFEPSTQRMTLSFVGGKAN